MASQCTKVIESGALGVGQKWVKRTAPIQNAARSPAITTATISRSHTGRSQGVMASAANIMTPAKAAACTPKEELGDANPPGSPRQRSIPQRLNRAIDTG